MRTTNTATTKSRGRPWKAVVAGLLVFALAFMSFDANLLHAAFADEGSNAASGQVEQGAEAEAGQIGADFTGDALESQDVATSPEEGQDAAEQGSASDPGGAGRNALEGQDGQGAQDSQEASGAQDAQGNQGADGQRDETPTAPQGDEATLEPDVSDEQGGADDEALPGQGTASPETGDGDATADDGEESAAEEGAEGIDARAGPDAFSDDTIRCFVTFYSSAPDSKPSILARKLVEAKPGQSANVDVSDVTAAPPSGEQVFAGWLYGGATFTDAVEVDPSKGDVALYPAFESGHWLRFATGDASADVVAVESQFIAAGAAVPETLPTTTRAGYAFAGWHLDSPDGQKIAGEDGRVLDAGMLARLLAEGDVELHASWTGVQTAFRIATWHENANDSRYTFQGVELYGDDPGERAISGETTAVSAGEAAPGFTAQPVEQKEIAGDGSTIVNVYFNRDTFTIEFHEQRMLGAPAIDDLTIRAKFGADIHDRWPKPSADGAGWPTSWYTQPDKQSNVFVTGIDTMPLGGAHFYLKADTGNNYSTVYLVQDVEGGRTFAEYVAQPFTSANSPITTADDYMHIPGFMVNAASEADARAIRENPVGDPLATHDSSFATSPAIGARFNDADEVTAPGDVPRRTLYFQYLRCQYDVVFIENGGPEVADATGIYYEAPLTDAAPSEYIVGETTYEAANGVTYEFAGWYGNEALVGDPFDFASEAMPVGNVVLYAKWEPARYLVQVDPAGGEFTNDSQSTYFWVSHGQPVGEIGAERDYVTDEDGTHVYRYETAASDDDGFGVARYEQAPEGDDGQRYRYSDGAFTLYGWHEVEGGQMEGAPFDFGEGVTEDTSIVALWRSAGSYDVAYNPVMKRDGVTVSGTVDTVLDAGYADRSPTYILNTPSGIESSDGNEYEFAGWTLVEGFDEGDGALVEAVYFEDDGFVVDSELARDNIIHLQALYKQVVADEPEQPSVPGDGDDDGEGGGDDDGSGGGDGDSGDGSGSDDGSGDSGGAGGSDGGNGGGDAGGSSRPSGGNASTTGSGTSEVGSGASGKAATALLPKTGDLALSVPIAVAGLALLALAVALVARSRRRRGEHEAR